MRDGDIGVGFLNSSNVMDAVNAGHLQEQDNASTEGVLRVYDLTHLSSKTSKVEAIAAMAVSCVLWTRILVGSSSPR